MEITSTVKEKERERKKGGTIKKKTKQKKMKEKKGKNSGERARVYYRGGRCQARREVLKS